MLELTPDEIADLPVDELGLKVLQDMLDRNEWHEGNYYISYGHSIKHDVPQRLPALQAIAEAVAWLHSNALLARNALNSNAEAIQVTRRGHEALKTGLSGVRALARIDAGLHPMIERQARRQFLLGEYENAIFSAMKAVEVRIRELGNFGNDMIGSKLISAAFNETGPLSDPAAESGERKGLQQLFYGAYAVLRNPSAHREVSFDDVAEAADAVMTASFLMRILDGVEKRINGTL